MHGIKETSDLIVFVGELAHAVKRVRADGVMDWKDIQHIAPLALKAKDAALGLGDIKSELADLTGEEIDELSKLMSEAIVNLIDSFIP